MRPDRGVADAYAAPRALLVGFVHVPPMVDLSFFEALMNPSGLVSLIALVIAAVAFAGYLKGRSEASLRAREIQTLSRALEQLTRLAVLEYGGISRLGKSLASALNPTGEATFQSPEAKAVYHALGPEPDRILEEAELVLSQAGKSMGWRYVPGFRER